MAWLVENCFWILPFIAFVAMHMFGHGGHGGHGITVGIGNPGVIACEKQKTGKPTARKPAKTPRNPSATRTEHADPRGCAFARLSIPENRLPVS